MTEPKWKAGKWALLILFTLQLFIASTNAATVTGIIRDRRGNLVSTNVNFRSIQRPVFQTPWIQPGWNVSTNSDTNGVFTISLTAGDYGVSLGSDARDAFIIAVPNTSSNYTLAQVITSRLTYTYTFSPQYEQLLNRDVAGGYAGLDASWGRLPSWLLGTNAASAGDTLYSDGSYSYWAPPGTGSGADASIGYVVSTSNTLYLVTSTASNALQVQITAAPTTAQLLAASNALTAKIDLKVAASDLLLASNALAAAANSVTNSSIVRQTQLTAASNTIVALISGGAGNPLTNNDTRDVIFLSTVTGSNNWSLYGDIRVGNYANLADELDKIAPIQTAHTVASNALRTLIDLKAATADLLGSSNALKALIDLKVANADLLLASNALRTDIDLRVSTSTLNTVSNALVAYANASTNSSIVRQTQLTAASNDLYSAIGTLTTAVGLKATTTDLLGASNALTSKIDLRVAVADFLLASNALRNDIDLKVTTATLNTASNAAITYASGTTNSSIVRQTQLTTASNAIVALIGGGAGNPLTNNDTRDIVFLSTVTGSNNWSLYGDIRVGAYANLADELDKIAPIQTAHTVASNALRTDITTTSNVLATATAAAATAGTTASNALNTRVTAALTNNDTRAITFTTDFNVSGDVAFAGPLDITGQIWAKYGLTANSTNFIRGQTEDAAPATNDFLLSWDASANSLKQTALNSLPVSYPARALATVVSNGLINFGSGAYQAYDVDLADIAALTHTSYGQGFLTLASSTTAKSYLGVPTDITTTSNALRTAYIAADVAASNALSSAKQDSDADLTAVAGLSSAGLIARTGAGTAAARTLTGTANELTVANGTGASGDPTISLPSTIDLGGKTSLEVPNSSNPTVDAFGELAGDNNLWAAGRGALVWYDGTSTVAMVPVLASDVPVAGQTAVWQSSGYATWETPTSSSSSTNQPRYAFGSRTGAHTVSARTNKLGFITSSGVTNWTIDSNSQHFTNQIAGFYQITAGYSYYSISNNVWSIMISTNGSHAANLIAYSEYLGGTGAATTSTNSVNVSGVVYLPTNTYISAWSDYTRSASGDIAYSAFAEYITITPVDFGGGGSSSGGSGDVTTAQLNTASNAVVTLLSTYDTTTSNGLYAQIVGGGINASTATNIAEYFATNSALVTSNGLITLLSGYDTTTSNGLYSVETARNAAVSNAIVSLLVANDTTTSNGLYSVETTRNAAVSNALAAIIAAKTNDFHLSVSNLWVGNFEAFRIGDWGNITNPVVDWTSTNAINYTPSNSFTITHTGTVPSGWYVKKPLRIVNTNSPAGYFFTNDMNFGSVNMLPAPSTNMFILHNWGGIIWISSIQQPEIGTNAVMRTRTGVYRTIEIPAPAYGTNATNWSATYVSGGSNLGIGPKDYWTFSETATNEIHFSFTMPLTWDASTLVARFLYATTNAIATQTNVFSISARTVSGQSMDGGTYGTAQIIRTASVANSNLTWTAATPNLTPSGTPAAGAFTEFKVTRMPGHADDNMSGLLRLYSVQIQYKESIVEPIALP